MSEEAPLGRGEIRYMRKERLIDGAVLGAISLFYGFLILPSSQFVDTMAFFNFCAARDILNNGLFEGITNLPFTVLGESGPDHQLLFHLIAAPFTLFDDAFFGLKLGAVFFAVLSTASIYFLFKMLRVPYVWLFVLLMLASSHGFLYRISTFGAQSLTIPLLLFSAYSVAYDKKVLAGILGLTLSWTSHTALIAVPIAFAGLVATRLAKGKWIRKASISLCVCAVIGQLLNPFLPESLEYLFFHLAYKGSNPWMLDVGQDWSRPTFWFLITELWLPNLLILALGLFFTLRQKVIKVDTLTVLLTWLVCLALAGRQMRFFEYSVATGVVLIALAFRDTEILLNKKGTVAIAALLACISFSNLTEVSSMIDEDNGPDSYRDAAEFLERNTEENEVVVNLHWRDYPLLYYHNANNRYAAGLDPYYLAFASPKHFNLIKKLKNGTRKLPSFHPGSWNS